MFTNPIRKIASKIVMVSMLFSVLAPLAGNSAIASGPLGTLRVGFDHVDGGYTIKNVRQEVVSDKDSGDCSYQSSGYFTCNEILPIGTYTVTFDDVDGMITPDPAHAVVLESSVTEAYGDYVAENVPTIGVLGIGVNHINGGYIIKNVRQEQVADVSASSCGPLQPSGYYLCSQSLPFGTYTVEFDSIQGYQTPPTAHVALTDNYSFNVDYVANAPTLYTLTVGVDLAQGGFTIDNVRQETVADVNPVSSCGPLQPSGYYQCNQILPPGTYTVRFDSVNGYNTPDDIHVALTQSGNIWANYIAEAPVLPTLTVGVNLAQGGFTIYNVRQEAVTEYDPVTDCGAPVDGYYMCDAVLPAGTYTVRFTSVDNYVKPSDIHVALTQSGTVWGFYSTIPTGVIQVQVVNQNNEPITDLPANEWQLKRCSNSNPASCTDIMASGGVGGVYDNILYNTYRIHFPNPVVPAGYSGRTVLPSVYQVLDAEHNTLTFTIKYTETSQQTGVAYVNVRTTPVPANVTMVTTDPARPDQQGVTSDLVAATPIYDLSDPDRFTLPTTVSGFTVPTDYYIICNPVPGGYLAPANIVVSNAQYAVNTEYLAGTCVYTQTNEVVTITIDTVGIEEAAIYVDGVEVRDTNDDSEISVVITTEEEHVISFEDKDPAHFTTPVDITIPADSLDSSMTPDQLRYLGYYVPLGNLATAEINTYNETGWVYLVIGGGGDSTMWNVGLATPGAPSLIVHFNETVSHEFHFQDRNPNYYLRAVPVTNPNTPGFSVSQNISQSGNDVTHFQEYYSYDGSESLDTVYLTGDYIAQANAAFFHARTTNPDPIFGEIYLDINGEPIETLVPGAQVWTRVFISDVVNDSDTTSFQSPITVDSLQYTAVPASYDLSTYTPSSTIYDLESTYQPGVGSNLIVQLIPAGVGSAGLDVTLDSTITQQTIDNAGTFQTTFLDIDPNADHTVSCPAVPNYATPNDLFIASELIQPGDNFAYCTYIPLIWAAEILIETSADDNINFSAPTIIQVNGVNQPIVWTDDSVAGTPATRSVWIDTRDTNIIIYGDMPGYVTPASDVVNVTPGSSWQDPNPANIFSGHYTLPQAGADLIFHLRELDPDGGPVPSTDVTVNVTTQQSDANGDTTFTDVDTTQVIDISFGDHPLGTGAYVTPLPLNFQANELQGGQTYEFYIYYVPVAFAVTLDVETLDELTQLINVNGAIRLVVNGTSTLYGYGTAQIVVSTDPQFSYLIDWGPTNPASQYIEPAVDPLPVNVIGMTAGQTRNIDGLYRLCQSGNCEVVTITAWDQTGTNILNTVDITVNGTVVGSGQHTGTYDVGAVLNIAFEDVDTHGVPDIHVNGVSVGTSHTTSYTVLDAPSPNTVDAYFPLEGGIGFNVATRDNQGSALTQNITHGITGTETTEPTPAFFVVDEDDLTSYTIHFSDRVGYITPGSVIVSNQAINSIPANVTITNNGVNYVAGTQLNAGDTYDITATYVPHFVIEKNITSEQTITNNNKRVDYQIVVTRHPDTAPGPMSITLQDTISNSGRTLSGSNGGTMSVVPQNSFYSICSNGCGDITAGPVTINIDNPGNSVTITYQTLSNNSSIPANQSSDFTNTLTGNYSDGGQTVTVTTNATVNVLAPPTSGPTPPGGGGPSGGGGHILIQGDMILEVTKLVSINNRDWFDASDEEDPFILRERYHGPLYTKVNVKNLGQVTATNIRFTEGFDQGDSEITSSEIDNVEGEEGFEYNETTGVMTIDSLPVGGEINFSYEQTVDEDGTRGELAEEYLVLEGFSTRLSASQDGLTKHGIGDHYPSWLTAGTPETPYEGSLLELEIDTDRNPARIGDEVVYHITATNNADFDLTGVIITWDYDENALDILNPFGGRNNGTEIHWDRGILRPGESAEYQVRVRVADSAPIGSNVRTTARGLVNELENPAAAEHLLSILAAIGDGPIELAQTGMPTFLLILASIFAYLTYTNTGRRRYLALKKAALRPF